MCGGDGNGGLDRLRIVVGHLVVIDEQARGVAIDSCAGLLGADGFFPKEAEWGEENLPEEGKLEVTSANNFGDGERLDLEDGLTMTWHGGVVGVEGP